jgi:hypothetical protein
MAKTRNRFHTYFQSESPKTKRAQKVLPAKTETEDIERAPASAIAEHEMNRLSLKATERFIKSGIAIEDAYGKLHD